MITIAEIAKMIDHSILHPTFTDDDLRRNCEVAKKYGTATVCVKPYHTSMAKELLNNSNVAICAVIGFPHGNSTSSIKVAEAMQVIADGATEVDMVINIAKALQGDWDYIDNELKMVSEVCLKSKVILKVIFETDFVVKDDDKIRLCQLCEKNKVNFVKTSTGYGFIKDDNGKYYYKGATEHDIQLLRKYCPEHMQIKASGGVRTLDEVLKFRKLGATRVGATATESIMKEAKERFKN